MARWLSLFGLIIATSARAGEPISFADEPIVVKPPAPQVAIVIARQEIRERYDAKLEQGLTDRILEMEKEIVPTEPAAKK